MSSVNDRLALGNLSGFVLSSGINEPLVPHEILGCPLTFRNSDDPAELRFATLLNIFNGAAFGDAMGMPAWVMLDCVLLPSFFTGIQGAARLLSDEKRTQINARLHQHYHDGDTPLIQVLKRAGVDVDSSELSDDEPVPLAEFGALPCFDHKRVVGISLYNICSGKQDNAIPKLGLISKALGLAICRRLGAETQIGVTQYNSAALNTHTRFGSLNLLQILTPLHTKADRTFIYSLPIPDEEQLLRIAEGETGATPSADAPLVRPEDTLRLREMAARLRAGTHRYSIVPPGYDRDGNGTSVLEESLEP